MSDDDEDDFYTVGMFRRVSTEQPKTHKYRLRYLYDGDQKDEGGSVPGTVGSLLKDTADAPENNTLAIDENPVVNVLVNHKRKRIYFVVDPCIELE